MVERMVLAGVLGLAAVVAAAFVRRRQPPGPTLVPGGPPRHLDRADFVRPDAPWLVVLFSSRTCDSCVDLAAKLVPLECEEVAVQEVEWSEHRDLHRRYGIDSVPLVSVVNGAGDVRAGFVGRVTATDLWAAVAEARQAGSSPEPGLGRFDTAR
jgi:hypothetical protein